MPVAIAEARTLAESGSRVAFFAESAGAIERVADIFNEYGVPYQIGLEQAESTPEYLAGRAYMAGSVASIYLIRGAVRRGVVFREPPSRSSAAKISSKPPTWWPAPRPESPHWPPSRPT